MKQLRDQPIAAPATGPIPWGGEQGMDGIMDLPAPGEGDLTTVAPRLPKYEQNQDIGPGDLTTAGKGAGRDIILITGSPDHRPLVRPAQGGAAFAG
ncbi:MAG: hypothetical protein F4Z10_01025 [Synechococcus sp. SB0666_bin_14]|nr:hypothetical protein [Synechococcus sp. SB0666_bin_14]MYG46646.1 hypothetical protein [Synechococcus sp. SB0675_bin_6]